MDLDSAWYLALNRAAAKTPRLHAVFTAYALWGGLTLLALMLIGAWWGSARRGDQAPRRVATAFLTGVGTVAALALNQLVSSVVARPRPFLRFPGALVLLHRSADFSFPSDHLMIAGAFVAGLALLDRRLGALSLFLALLLGAARVYCGVHYPSDVAAGLLLGGLVTLGIQLAGHRAVTALAHRLEHTRLRPLVRAA